MHCLISKNYCNELHAQLLISKVTFDGIFGPFAFGV